MAGHEVPTLSGKEPQQRHAAHTIRSLRVRSQTRATVVAWLAKAASLCVATRHPQHAFGGESISHLNS